MLVSTNITNTDMDVERYRDADDLRRFCDEFGLDGLEVMPVAGSRALYTIPPERVTGVHLPFYTSWLDFWRGDEEALLREYGSLDNVRAVFGGDRPDCMVAMLDDALDFARSLGARYVVFHVSNVTVDECLTDRMVHGNEEVCAAAAEIVNRLSVAQEDGFDFLVENLWWPGLTLTRPEVTRSLMEAIRLPRKGIMLDTGHLMHTNRDLRTQEEAVDYILGRLDALGDAASWIRGVHLHQSLTGAWVREALARGLDAGGDYWTRFGHAMEYVLGVDRHLPFDSPAARRLLERVRPEYLTHEFITETRDQHAEALRRQRGEALGNRDQEVGSRE